MKSRYCRALLLLVAVTMSALAAGPLVAPAESAGPKRLIPLAGVCQLPSGRQAAPRAQERTMRCLINRARMRAGLRPLRSARSLGRSARLKSRDMMRCDSFSHTACGRDLAYVLKRAGFARGCWAAAENIAWGQARNGDVRRIFVSWMRSPAHRANILDPSYRTLGVGMRRGTFQGRKRARTWTGHLGRRC